MATIRAAISPPALPFAAEFFRALNGCVEPAVRAGWAAPELLPAGLVVLEHTGRVSGARHSVPLLGTVMEGCVVVATYRGARSQWVRNLAAGTGAAVWVSGRRHECEALVFAPGKELPGGDGLPPYLHRLATDVWPNMTALGWAVVVLLPR